MVLACAGDIPTLETVAAASLLRTHLPDLRVRVVNVVDLMRLEPDSEHPHGLPDAEFDALFTRDRPVIFAYHGYPCLIHRLTYRRANHQEMHVRGYKEEGTTTTPFDMVMLNDMDRFHLVMDVIDRVPSSGRARPNCARRWPTSACATASTPAPRVTTCPTCATGPGRADPVPPVMILDGIASRSTTRRGPSTASSRARSTRSTTPSGTPTSWRHGAAPPRCASSSPHARSVSAPSRRWAAGPTASRRPRRACDWPTCPPAASGCCSARTRPSEIAFGAVGRFWAGETAGRRSTPTGSATFDRPGFAKLACNFSLRSYGEGHTLVSYECRTLATDAEARAGFLRYWRPLSPFIGVVLRAQLGVVAATAPGPAGDDARPRRLREQARRHRRDRRRHRRPADGGRSRRGLPAGRGR